MSELPISGRRIIIIIIRKSANKCVYLLFFFSLKNWLAYDVLPASSNVTERRKLFSGLGAPKKESNYAFCHVGKSNGLLYVFDEPLFSLVQLKRKRVSPISERHYSGPFL